MSTAVTVPRSRAGAARCLAAMTACFVALVAPIGAPFGAIGAPLSGLFGERCARAADMRGHLEVGAAHFLSVGGAWQGREIGWGGVGAASLELGISRRFGLEARLLGGRFLKGDPPEDPSFKRVESTGLLGGALGVRIHPFIDLAGPFLAASVGGVRTGDVNRIAFDARIGWDFRAGVHAQVGPFVGYLQVVRSSDDLRPYDARALLFGVHVGFDEGLAQPPAEVMRAAPEPEEPPIRCEGGACAEPMPTGTLRLPDRCPGEPDDFIGDSDLDGCPSGEAEVKVVGDQIVLNDRVYFDFAIARVKHRSWPLLKTLAQLILAHPEYVLVHVYGHTDEIGDDFFNQKLSDERAQAVKKKLIEYGVPADRLDAKGFGKSRPRVDGRNETSRQENRRVEFIIERREGS